MVRAGLLLLVLVSAAACKKEAPPPPASGAEAPRGLPPADPAELAKNPAPPPAAAGDKALPPNHPTLPPDHPPTAGGGAAQPAAPAAGPGGEPSPHGGMGAAAPGGPALEGEISVDPKLAAEVKSGDTIYLIARAVGADGKAQKVALAATRLEVNALPVRFKLDGSNVMAANAAFSGEVELTARVDRDREAMSREAGDIEGVVKATVPANAVKIVLDTKVAP